MRWGIGSHRRSRLWRAAGVVGLLVGLSACLAPGQLDPHFGGGDGLVVTDVGGPEGPPDRADDLAVQRDGRIVVVGSANGDLLVLRYRRDGSPDPTFGGDGVVTTDLDGRSTGEEALAVALQRDGRIVVGGRVLDANFDSRFVVARYLPNGQLDTSFGGDGVVESSFVGPQYTGGASGLAIQPDGRIVAAGSVYGPNYLLQIGVARFLATGSPDPAFGDGGEVRVGRLWSNEADVALQPDGGIVVAGTGDAAEAVGEVDFNVVAARLLPGGALDTTFGTGGAAVVDLAPTVQGRALALQRDGKVVIGGLVSLDTDGSEEAALVRLTTAGAPDATFGGGDGVVTSSFTGSDGLGALAVQGDGKIVGAGYAAGGTGAGGFVVARYLPGGALDPGFGGGDGWATADLGDIDSATSIAVLRTGSLLVAGVVGREPGTDVGLARLQG